MSDQVRPADSDPAKRPVGNSDSCKHDCCSNQMQKQNILATSGDHRHTHQLIQDPDMHLNHDIHCSSSRRCEHVGNGRLQDQHSSDASKSVTNVHVFGQFDHKVSDEHPHIENKQRQVFAGGCCGDKKLVNQDRVLYKENIVENPKGSDSKICVENRSGKAEVNCCSGRPHATNASETLHSSNCCQRGKEPCRGNGSSGGDGPVRTSCCSQDINLSCEHSVRPSEGNCCSVKSQTNTASDASHGCQRDEELCHRNGSSGGHCSSSKRCCNREPESQPPSKGNCCNENSKASDRNGSSGGCYSGSKSCCDRDNDDMSCLRSQRPCGELCCHDEPEVMVDLNHRSCCAGDTEHRHESRQHCIESSTHVGNNCAHPSKNVTFSAHHHDLKHVGCCDSTDNDIEGSSFPLCLALIQENGTDVVVYDAQGIPKTFKHSGVNDSKCAIELCFAKHGADSTAEAFLSPCFDKEGIHGAPPEFCFCGVKTPHLHAHIKDPTVCNSGSKSLEILASEVLYPESQTEVLKINVSTSMPKVCNSLEIVNQMLEHQFCVKIAKKTRLHLVQHDDHVDYLVHDDATGELHLEHPCTTCGKNDVHGKFRTVDTRILSSSGPGGGVHLQFFEVESTPFNILDFLQSFFEVNSERVNAVEKMREHRLSPSRHSKRSPTVVAASPQTYVRSTVLCSRICCSAEIPIVKKILRKVSGVRSVSVNVPLKIVYVDHDPDNVTAEQLVEALNQQNMGAKVQRNGAGAQMSASASKSRSQFFVRGICCASEIPIVKSILLPVPGVTSVSINTTTKVVYVDHEPSVVTAEVISNQLTKQGFKSEILRDANSSDQGLSNALFVRSMLSFSNCVQDSKSIQHSTSKYLEPLVAGKRLEEFNVNEINCTVEVVHCPFVISAGLIANELTQATNCQFSVLCDGSDPELWNFAASLPVDNSRLKGDNDKFVYPKPNVIVSGILWVISMISLAGGKLSYLKYVALLAIVFGIPPIALKTFQTLRRYQFDTNCLMFFASVGAIALREYTEAAAVVFLFALSEWLEVRATTRARRALSAIVDLRPEKACLVHPFTKELVVVPPSLVPVHSKISVRAGDKIPCDGIVIEGSSTVNESSLTGESKPVKKIPGDSVSGGTVNSGKSPLLIESTSTSENSAVAKLIRLIEEAEANRSQTERLVDQFAKVYTPLVVLVAVGMCSLSWAFGRESGQEWTNNGLILLVIACPCALIISTPVAYVAGIAAAAQKGVLIKGGAYLESLARVKHICFDKTGTLTNGSFSLLHLRTFSASLSRTEVIQYLTAIEEYASHPVAQAILTASKHERISVPKTFSVESHTIINGEGLSGVVNGRLVYVGNERLFERLGILSTLSDSDYENLNQWKALGGTVGLMSIEGYGIVCAFDASDSVRKEARKVLASLRKRGVFLTMLTGDNRNAAEAIGGQLGLTDDEIKAGLKPEDKLSFVTDFSLRTRRESSKTCCLLPRRQQDEEASATALFCNPFASNSLLLFCGDGVNDAPALAAADVGVAMGAGAALAMETADVTLLDSNLEKIEYCIVLGRRVTAKITQNVVFSLVVKLIVLVLAVLGWTTLWAAIASDVGSMLAVTLNAMTLLPSRSPPAIEEEILFEDIETQMANQP